jgi:hypothetical protein
MMTHLSFLIILYIILKQKSINFYVYFWISISLKDKVVQYLLVNGKIKETS